MSDLPIRFQLKTGDLQRSDTPSIPKDVIREALANALMHRDYRVGQAVQIIRYSNRIEFHNPGYSLKPFDELGQSGSLTRNVKIAAVFHDLKFAETKGTGITTMKKLMHEAGLTTPPLIETDRDQNKFNLLLLPHHLLDENNLRWLSQFHSLKLSESDMRALVFSREVGAITNQDYRQINGTHTLAASNALRHLRDLGLLTMKGSGSETYYQLIPQIIEISNPALLESEKGTPYIRGSSEEQTSYVNPLYKGLDAIPKGFPNLSQNLKEKIINLRARSPKKQTEAIILELCSLDALQPVQMAKILGRDAQYLRIYFLSKMVKKRKLTYQYPGKTAHPQQAYRAPIAESEKGTPYTNPLYKGLDAIPKGFPNLPQNLKEKIINLKTHSSKAEIEAIIIELCSLAALQSVQIAKILDRNAQYLRVNFLSKLIKKKKLGYQHPGKTAHPQQAYKAFT